MAKNEKKKPSDPEKIAAGNRLRDTRIALGYGTGTELAIVLKVRERTYLTWEEGIAFPPIYFLKKLKDRFGVSADWILFADPSGLPQRVLGKLSFDSASLS